MENNKLIKQYINKKTRDIFNEFYNVYDKIILNKIASFREHMHFFKKR